MTEAHPPAERLSELIDGELPAQAAAAVEAHLAACVTCRRDLAAMRDLVDRAALLPSSIDPPPEAWFSLRRRLSADPPAFARTTGRWAREWGLRAAAALLLVAGSSAVTVLALRSRAATPASPVAGPPATAVADRLPPSALAVERSYVEVVNELTETLEAQRGSLAPSTIATLERTLRIIDAAIAEARAALAADPRNDTLLELLSANYEQKVQLLRRASELPARS